MNLHDLIERSSEEHRRLLIEGVWCQMAGGTKLVAHPEFKACALVEREDGELSLEEVALLAGEPLLRIESPFREWVG